MKAGTAEMSFLVTGGSGFVGTWVLRNLLERGVKVAVYDVQANRERWDRVLGRRAERVSFFQGDLVDRERLERVCEDVRATHLVHLGALLTPACQEDPWLACQVNVLGSVGVFELARQRKEIQGLAYASSLAVYGPPPDEPSPAGVVDTHAPSFYGAYKRSVELIADQYWKHYGVSSFGLRPHVVYGPEREQGLTAGPSLAARAIAEGHSFEMNYTGQAGYDYVEDVALALVRGATESPSGAHVVDLPSRVATPEEIRDILDKLVPGAAARLSITGAPIPSNEPLERCLIHRLFPDWEGVSLHAGFERTLQFYGWQRNT
ncbi:MAG: NAD(P)-dependent oxidoreductase [Planctomycetota bacterium]|nr:NAD(P)-dependent oxidoreductase [Planctomycetota bacterium]